MRLRIDPTGSGLPIEIANVTRLISLDANGESEPIDIDPDAGPNDQTERLVYVNLANIVAISVDSPKLSDEEIDEAVENVVDRFRDVASTDESC